MQNSEVLSVNSSPLSYILSYLLWVSLDSQLHLLNSESLLGSTSVPSPCVGANKENWELSYSSKLGHLQDSYNVFPISQELMPLLFISNVLKCFMHFFFSFFHCFRQESKYNLYYSSQQEAPSFNGLILLTIKTSTTKQGNRSFL